MTEEELKKKIEIGVLGGWGLSHPTRRKMIIEIHNLYKQAGYVQLKEVKV